MTPLVFCHLCSKIYRYCWSFPTPKLYYPSPCHTWPSDRLITFTLASFSCGLQAPITTWVYNYKSCYPVSSSPFSLYTLYSLPLHPTKREIFFFLTCISKYAILLGNCFTVTHLYRIESKFLRVAVQSLKVLEFAYLSKLTRLDILSLYPRSTLYLALCLRGDSLWAA